MFMYTVVTHCVWPTSHKGQKDGNADTPQYMLSLQISTDTLVLDTYIMVAEV